MVLKDTHIVITFELILYAYKRLVINHMFTLLTESESSSPKAEKLFLTFISK